DALESVPRVFQKIERAMDNAALERGVLKLNLNSLSDAVSLLIRLLDEGAQLEADHRQRLLDLANRCKTNIRGVGDFLLKVGEELDSNSAVTAELGLTLVKELEQRLAPVPLAKKPKK
ncbi:MAG: hypothetical protein ACN6OP_12810, partial [Pseudomonadales bacterium]